MKGIYESDIGPIIGLIPLGTGNDLARSLGLGNNYPGSDTLIGDLLPRYSKAPFTELDRWKILFFDENEKLKQRRTGEMLAYCSIGFEADITYSYDQSRRSTPRAFNKRWKSKMQWVLSGVGGVVDEIKGNATLNDAVEVYVDGERVRLPSHTKSVVICNIQSMSDGMFYWGEGPGSSRDLADWDPPTMGDGKLEVMAAKGISKWLQMKMGMDTRYRRLAQPRKVRLVMKRELAVMVDGEVCTLTTILIVMLIDLTNQRRHGWSPKEKFSWNCYIGCSPWLAIKNQEASQEYGTCNGQCK